MKDVLLWSRRTKTVLEVRLVCPSTVSSIGRAVHHFSVLCLWYVYAYTRSFQHTECTRVTASSFIYGRPFEQTEVDSSLANIEHRILNSWTCMDFGYYYSYLYNSIWWTKFHLLSIVCCTTVIISILLLRKGRFRDNWRIDRWKRMDNYDASTSIYSFSEFNFQQNERAR